jgi:citrate synthase
LLKTRFEDILASNDKKIEQLSEKALASDIISNELYEKYNVFRGLRDNKGVGVITGLTEISEMNGYITNEDGIRVPIEGVMYYRGIDIFDIIKGIMKNNRFGYEECAYLLLCGSLRQFCQGYYSKSSLQGCYECHFQKHTYPLLV